MRIFAAYERIDRTRLADAVRRLSGSPLRFALLADACQMARAVGIRPDRQVRGRRLAPDRRQANSDPKALAAASALFQWLEAEDTGDPRYVIHTIRKYHFKGNTLVKTTEKQYRKKKGADVGNVFR